MLARTVSRRPRPERSSRRHPKSWRGFLRVDCMRGGSPILKRADRSIRAFR